MEFGPNGVARINEVALRRARLVLRWVTVRGYRPTVLVFDHRTQANSAWPSLRGQAQRVLVLPSAREETASST